MIIPVLSAEYRCKRQLSSWWRPLYPHVVSHVSIDGHDITNGDEATAIVLDQLELVSSEPETGLRRSFDIILGLPSRRLILMATFQAPSPLVNSGKGWWLINVLECDDTEDERLVIGCLVGSAYESWGSSTTRMCVRRGLDKATAADLVGDHGVAWPQDDRPFAIYGRKEEGATYAPQEYVVGRCAIDDRDTRYFAVIWFSSRWRMQLWVARQWLWGVVVSCLSRKWTGIWFG